MIISKEEIGRRTGLIAKYLNNEGIDGFLVFDSYNIFYTCGFYHVPTERPVVQFVHSSGKSLLFVPQMEEEEASKLLVNGDIKVYFEYPGKFNILDWILKEIKDTFSSVKNIALDKADYRAYKKIQDSMEAVAVSDFIYDIRMIKSEEEISYLKKSAIYSDFIVDYGIHILQPGRSEMDLLSEMEKATVKKMLAELGEIIYVPGGPAGGLLPSGRRTSLPHALPSAKIVQASDTVLLSCGANVKGYRTECERTCFVGEPAQEKIKAFEVMRKAQEMGISLMKPGITCADVDRQVLSYIRESGYGQYIKHRTGHGKGLCEHEIPWVDEGDSTVLRPGMVLSSEPAIYMEGFSGFRHSDTVVVTNNEPLVLTQYTKKLEDLVVSI